MSVNAGVADGAIAVGVFVGVAGVDEGAVPVGVAMGVDVLAGVSVGDGLVGVSVEGKGVDDAVGVFVAIGVFVGVDVFVGV